MRTPPKANPLEMRIQFQLLLVVCAALFTLPACEEEEQVVIVATSPYDLVATVTSNRHDPESYSYDAQGRCILADYSNGNYQTYTYSSGQMTRTYYENGASIGSSVYELNADGYIINLHDYQTWSYNEDGQLINRQTNLGWAVINHSYEYTNGNMTRDGLPGSSDYTHYSYDLEKVENRMIGPQTFQGNPSYNLKNSMLDYYDSEITSGHGYTYTYDSLGRVVTESRSGSAGYSEEISFTYID